MIFINQDFLCSNTQLKIKVNDIQNRG